MIMAKPVLKVTLDQTQKGRGCSWLSLSIEDTANSQSKTHKDADGTPWVNMMAFYGAEAVKLDDGRVSVFRIFRCGREELRRNSALRREIDKSVKTFVEAL